MIYLLVFGIIFGYIIYLSVNLCNEIEEKEKQRRQSLNEDLVGVMPVIGPGGKIFKLKTYRDLHAETSYNRPYITHQFVENGLLHRLDGPARIWTDGREEWWQNGQLHRLDGPAIVRYDGTQEWYQNGLLHRLDGPARIWGDGTKEWYQNDNLHRLDGPARIWRDGREEWWQNHKNITPEVNKWIKETGVSWPFDEETVVLFKLRFL